MDTNNKILWVEDNPDGVVSILRGLMHEDYRKLDGFLENVEWAFDINDALKLLSQNNYSMHILDADIPHNMSEERKEMLKKALKENTVVSNTDSFLKIGLIKQIWDGYVLIYDKIRGVDPLNEKTIVLSSSQVAPVTAFALKIPFYSKYGSLDNVFARINSDADPVGTFPNSSVSDIIINIRSERYKKDYEIYNFSREELSHFSEWERGNIYAFVNKYVVKK